MKLSTYEEEKISIWMNKAIFILNTNYYLLNTNLQNTKAIYDTTFVSVGYLCDFFKRSLSAMKGFFILQTFYNIHY